MKHVMLDIETLGIDSNSYVLSIGAAEFDATGVGAEFYQAVKEAKQVSKWKRVINPDTIKWWATQNAEAKKVFTDPKAVMLDTALTNFARWMSEAGRKLVWGNGPHFDNVILANAYAAVGDQTPWGFRDNRDYRTLKDAAKAEETGAMKGFAHNALDDARYQAEQASAWMKKLGMT